MKLVFRRKPERHWEWQENSMEAGMHGVHSYNTMYLASLDVRTAFNVAEPRVVAEQGFLGGLLRRCWRRICVSWKHWHFG